jgi:hypothetical protein
MISKRFVFERSEPPLSWHLTLKLEELHEDVRDLQGELAEVKGQIEDLQSEDR